MKSPGSLKYKLFQYEVERGGRDNWACQVKKLIADLGFNYLWNDNNVTKLQLNRMIETLYDQYLQSWFSDLNNSSKLVAYKTFKTVFEMEKCLTCITNTKYTTALARFRCAAHRLSIEEGRYRNVERHDRICTRCNMQAVEDEYHFALVCPFYRELRFECLPRYYCVWPNIQKFTSLLASNQTSLIKKLSKFIYQANLKRESI